MHPLRRLWSANTHGVHHRDELGQKSVSWFSKPHLASARCLVIVATESVNKDLLGLGTQADLEVARSVPSCFSFVDHP